jgi:3-phenylpropionate/cinnamic acid dioxygenase small subunit
VDIELAGLLDRQQVVDVLVRYTLALDSRDWALLRTCFADSAVARYSGLRPANGYAAIEDVCRRSLEPLTASQHLLGNILIELDGGHARATSYVQAQHVRTGLPGGDKYIVAGIYRDELSRTPDGWRIARRELDQLWTDGNPAVLSGASR